MFIVAGLYSRFDVTGNETWSVVFELDLSGGNPRLSFSCVSSSEGRSADRWHGGRTLWDWIQLVSVTVNVRAFHIYCCFQQACHVGHDCITWQKDV